MKRLQDRINAAYNSLPEPRITKTALWKAAGVTSGTCSNWFQGRNEKIAWSHAVAVAPFLNVRPEWLYNGEGPMREDPDQRARQEISKEASEVAAQAMRLAVAWINMDVKSRGAIWDQVMAYKESDALHTDSVQQYVNESNGMSENVTTNYTALDPGAALGREDKKNPRRKVGG